MNEKNAQRPLKGRSLLCLPRDYTVIDIETNPTPEGMEPIEIAALRVTDGKRTAAFDEFVRPSRPVDGWITALTGITDGMVRHAPLPEQVLPAFLQFIGGGLLMGFWCEVDGDDAIHVDHVELDEGAWVSREELRETYHDTGISLTGEMITKFALGEEKA